MFQHFHDKIKAGIQLQKKHQNEIKIVKLRTSGLPILDYRAE